MKNIFILLFIYFYASTLFAQEKEYIEPYSHKFYKVNNQIFNVFTRNKKFSTGNLLRLQLKNNSNIKQVFPPEGTVLLYGFADNFSWDIDANHYLYLQSIKLSSQIGHTIYDVIFYEYEYGEQIDFTKHIAEQKDIISHNLTGIQDFTFTRAVKGHHSDYWHYDLILQKDETLLMPVAYKDSLYLYYYKDKAWATPNYQGAEKNAENDYWTRIWQIKHDFKTHFRAFQIENDLYFLTNSDTTIYKYENNTLKEIGKIQPQKNQRTLFLIDKDLNKVYFLMAENITIIAEERNRFALLKPEDELYRAVKSIIDAKDE